jgi:hypothetical protein
MRVSRVKFRQSCSHWDKDSPSNSDGFGNNSFILSNKDTCVALSTFLVRCGVGSSPISANALSVVEWEDYSTTCSVCGGGSRRILDDPEPSTDTFPIAESTNLSRRVCDKPGSKNVGPPEQPSFRGTIFLWLSIGRVHQRRCSFGVQAK